MFQNMYIIRLYYNPVELYKTHPNPIFLYQKNIMVYLKKEK